MEAGFQKYVWANGAGDDWFKRNKDTLGTRDAFNDAIKTLKIKPTRVLEIGCANGWRLKKLRDEYGCVVKGIEPSDDARAAASEMRIDVYNGTADNLGCFADSSFDLVIFGFCLCFVSPEDWMAMVKESDRVLSDKGHLAIYDFVGTRFVKRRMMKITADASLEAKPLYIYNFNWPELWLAHPAYRVAVDIFDLNHAEVCTVLRKDINMLLEDDIKVT